MGIALEHPHIKRSDRQQFGCPMFIDAPWAHIEAMCDSDNIYLALADEDAKEGQCARPRKWTGRMLRAA